jgi:hypothetical protein
MQAINGERTSIHAVTPTRWQVATFDAVGLATDYVDPDPTQRSFDFNAGIAVSGDIDTLPVRELDEASPEWAHLVARHVKAFLAADHAEAKQRGVHLKGRTTVNTTKDLRAGDVSLYRVELDAKHAYEYFEVTVQRPPAAAPPQGCPTPSVEYRGMIEQRGRTETVRWLSSTGAVCGTGGAVMEVVGGLRGAAGVRLVVEYSNDRAQSFAVINPVLPESQIRREPRLAAVPLLHQDGEPLRGAFFAGGFRDQLPARRADVTPARLAHGDDHAALGENLREAADARVRRPLVGNPRRFVERQQVHLGLDPVQ